MFQKGLSARILVVIAIVNFILFFGFLSVPYYILGTEYYIPKSNTAWGYAMPNSSEAWFFFILAFVFLALWAVTVGRLIWERPDIAQKGIHPTYCGFTSK